MQPKQAFNLPSRELFVARITATGSGENAPHGWNEMVKPTPGARYIVKPNGRSGTVTENSAYSPKGNALPIGAMVVLSPRAVVGSTESQAFDVVALASPDEDSGSGSGEQTYIDVVTNICLMNSASNGSGSGSSGSGSSGSGVGGSGIVGSGGIGPH
jgi:hypothetical protein